MSMKPCGALAVEWLDDFAGQETEFEGFDEVVVHLAACPQCSNYIESLRNNDRSSKTLVKSLPQDSFEVDDGVTQSVEPVVGGLKQQLPVNWAELDILDPSSSEGVIGSLLKYDILEVRGRGGMGVVLKGYDRRLKRVVAIKLMSRRLMQSEKSLKRFEREAILAASISHANVVTIHGVESHRGVPFIVMEYVDGKSLSQRIAEHGNLTVMETIRLSSQIASGLAAAHSRGVIHRDIKPGNIMLENGIGRVKITDFGLARVAQDNSDLTSLGEAVGTPLFMSPEQVEGEELTTATDVFSFGGVIHAMLFGQSPFVGGHQLKVLQRITHMNPPRLDETNPEVPRNLATMVTRMLEKDPEKRTITAAEVEAGLNADLLSRNQSGMGLVIPESRQPGHSSRKMAVGLVLLMFVIGLALLLTKLGGINNVIDSDLESEPQSFGASTDENGSDAEGIDFAEEQRVAEYVLQRAGTLTVRSWSGDHVVIKTEDFPDVDFAVIEVEFSMNDAVTDEDVRQLKPLSRIERIQLQGTAISDNALTTIGGLKRLNYLGMGRTEISDSRLSELKQLKNLERLNLQATEITSKGIRQLTSLSQLMGLYLNDTKVDDFAVSDIASMEAIRRLELCRTQITKAAIDQFANMSNLEELHIAETATSGAEWQRLDVLQGLKTLNLKGVDVDDASLAYLKEALPGCIILQ